MFLSNFRDSGAGENIATFILGMAGVAFEPVPGDVVVGGEFVEGDPQIFVLDRGLSEGAPVLTFPERNALGDAGFDVFGIGVEGDVATFAEGAESFDGAGEFHAVVRRGGFAAANLLALLAVFEDGGPSTRAWITGAGAIGVDGDEFHARDCSTYRCARQRCGEMRMFWKSWFAQFY